MTNISTYSWTTTLSFLKMCGCSGPQCCPGQWWGLWCDHGQRHLALSGQHRNPDNEPDWRLPVHPAKPHYLSARVLGLWSEPRFRQWGPEVSCILPMFRVPASHFPPWTLCPRRPSLWQNKAQGQTETMNREGNNELLFIILFLFYFQVGYLHMVTMAIRGQRHDFRLVNRKSTDKLSLIPAQRWTW